jgi:hypothetical protein
MHLRHDTTAAVYYSLLDMLRQKGDMRFRAAGKPPKFGAFGDWSSYGGFIPSSKYLGDIYKQDHERRMPWMDRYASMLVARVLSGDHSFKLIKRITMHGVRVFFGLWTMTNEYHEIVHQQFVFSKSLEEVRQQLHELQDRFRLRGHPIVEVYFTDQAAEDRDYLVAACPSLQADVMPKAPSSWPLLELPVDGTVKTYTTSGAITDVCNEICEAKEAIGLDMEWETGQFVTKEGIALVQLARPGGHTHDSHINH